MARSDADAVVHTASTGSFAPVTPDDAAIIPPTRGLYVGVTGDVKVRGAVDGKFATFVALAAGIGHPIRVDQVWSNGTSALNIIALY